MVDAFRTVEACYSSMVLGEISVAITFDRSTRTGKVSGFDVDLGTDRIVLVDDVDTQPRLVGTLPLMAELQNGLIASAIRTSDAAVRFVKCDLESPDVAASAMYSRLCTRWKQGAMALGVLPETQVTFHSGYMGDTLPFRRREHAVAVASQSR